MQKNLEEEIISFQKALIEDYRKIHPEETVGLTDEEVALMNPMTESDTFFLMISYLEEEIIDLKDSIEADKRLLNDSRTPSITLHEIRSDIISAQHSLSHCLMALEELKKKRDLEGNYGR